MNSRSATAAKMIGPLDGKLGFLGTIGVRFMIWGEEAGEHFALVVHPMSPRAMAAPCTAIRERTNTVTRFGAVSEHCLATKWSLPSRAILCSSLATNGIPSGTPVMNRPASSRLSLQPALSTFLANFRTRVESPIFSLQFLGVSASVTALK